MPRHDKFHDGVGGGKGDRVKPYPLVRQINHIATLQRFHTIPQPMSFVNG